MLALEIAAFALSAASVVMLSVLVTRRWELARRERHHRTIEDRLKQVALELLHTGTEPPADLTAEEREALADLLGRYARTLTGPTHARIVDYFARQGTIRRDVSLLSDAGPAWRRASAAFRLGDIGNAEAVGALIGALRDRDRDVRIAAARSLGRLRIAEAGAELVAAAAERRVPEALVRWALLQIGSPVLPELRSLLASPDERERAAALQLIGLLGGPSDAGAARERLRDGSALVRTQAARALGRLGGERDLPGLIEALEDRIAAVRAAAATALGYLRDRRALDALVGHAEADPVFEVGRECARAVARIDPALAAEEATRGESDHLREAADLVAIR